MTANPLGVSMEGRTKPLKSTMSFSWLDRPVPITLKGSIDGMTVEISDEDSKLIVSVYEKKYKELEQRRMIDMEFYCIMSKITISMQPFLMSQKTTSGPEPRTSEVLMLRTLCERLNNSLQQAMRDKRDDRTLYVEFFKLVSRECPVFWSFCGFPDIRATRSLLVVCGPDFFML